MKEPNNYEIHFAEGIEPESIGSITELKIEGGAYFFYNGDVVWLSVPVENVHHIRIK